MHDEMSQFDDLITALKDQADTIGLYLQGAQIQSTVDPEVLEKESALALMDRGEEFIICATFQIGDVAWSDRVQNPEALAAEIEFDLIAPSEEEIMLQLIMDEKVAGKFLDLEGDEE